MGLPDEGVVVLVGPNNAGKSASLRELLTFPTHHPANPLPVRYVVTEAAVKKEGTPDELITG